MDPSRPEGRSGNEVLDQDRALWLSARAWGSPAEPPRPAGWPELASPWRDRLVELDGTDEADAPPAAVDLLRDGHRAQARPDLDHVHPTWWLRALQDESPAVRRILASQGPGTVRAVLGSADGATGADQAAAAPEAAAWVLALWAERLVGGQPPHPAEPPVILALAGLAPGNFYRLCHAAGIAKAALAADPEHLLDSRISLRARRDWFQAWFSRQDGSAAAGARSLAARDVASAGRSRAVSARRTLANLGLLTMARLLNGCEPYRVRWALQHVPYPTAKRVRTLMAASRGATTDMRQAESMILKSARERLILDRPQLPRSFPSQSRGEDAD